jgi:uncharacterized membrane protein YcaP (DUF421 family)
MQDALSSIFELGPKTFEVVLRCVIVYGFLLIAFRLSGKREMGQMTPFDLVLILLISNSVQNAMVGEHTSVTAGILAAATLFAANLIAGRIRAKHPTVRKLLEGSPTVLIRDGKVVTDGLRRESIAVEELEAAVREHGLERIEDVDLAMLEIDGSISVLKFDGSRAQRTRRRFRALRDKPM